MTKDLVEVKDWRKKHSEFMKGRKLTTEHKSKISKALKDRYVKIAHPFSGRSGESTNDYKHGFCKTRMYRVWGGMKSRCYDQNCSSYIWYGDRGIKVCDEWKNNFMSFREWALINGYQDNLTIDRVNPNGDYSPDNCQWITMSKNVSKRHMDGRLI